jgi:hypothetical protein
LVFGATQHVFPMEDAISVQPLFCHQKNEISNGFHFFSVFDSHSCSHVSAHILFLSLFLSVNHLKEKMFGMQWIFLHFKQKRECIVDHKDADPVQPVVQDASVLWVGSNGGEVVVGGEHG